MKNTVKRFISGAAGLALAAGAFLGLAVPAQAAPVTVDDATFHWQVNREAGSGAYFGGSNWLVAGELPDVHGVVGRGATVWSDEDGAKYYKAAEGNVTITRPTFDPETKTHNFDEQVPATWEFRNSQSPTDASFALRPYLASWNQVNIANGTGWVDPAAGTAEIQWTGSFSLVFYGGMTYWSVNDPKLTVQDGKGVVTARLSGYGASMQDLTKWTKLDDANNATIATLSNVVVTENGIESTIDYEGVEFDSSAYPDATPQDRSKEGWGSFPQDWVEFNIGTGQSSYWYSSGGAADPRKKAEPITINYTAQIPAEPLPECSVDGSVGADGDANICVDTEIPVQPGEEPGEDPDDPVVPPAPTGEFRWKVAENNGVVLGGSAYNEGGNVTATGELPTVTVIDTRSNSGGWSVSGVASDFTAASGTESFGAAALGWAPQANAEGIAAGVVEPNNPGLANTAQLGSSLGATGEAGVQLKAALNLNVLKDNVPKPGNYRSTLTLTTIAQ
ncbi:hypothetical protein [Trueperella bialowiezensis]|uniref:Htaa n=1 Tax=Trueperella bialowiezensis TaxID=312285 RepID=A0A3S4Z5C7_9ACTO|nr:hypothetical protein [Trueperella bialowiezensis]VEI13318.1 Uncharacterised protein [Trueperella bialowiezensis]